MHRAALQAAATVLIATALAVVPQNASADVGKLRVLSPAERAERLERLRPTYQMPWLLPTAGPASVMETTEAFNAALWTLATPEWTPDLVMVAEVSKLDYRINPKKNPIACRPEGGSAEIHFDHKKTNGAAAVALLRIEDVACDAAHGNGVTSVAMYFDDGTIRLGLAQLGQTSITVVEWRAVGDFGGPYNAARSSGGTPGRPIVRLYHTADFILVGQTDFVGNVYFHEDGSRILESRRVPYGADNHWVIGSAPQAAYVNVPGVGLVSGLMNYENGFALPTGFAQIEDAHGRWRMWAFVTETDSTASGVMIAGTSNRPRKLNFHSTARDTVQSILVETAETTELGPPGVYDFEGRVTLAKGTAELRDMLDLARGRLRTPTADRLDYVHRKTLEWRQQDAERMDEYRRSQAQLIEQKNAQYAAERRAAEARSREARMQAFAEMNRLVNNIRDQRMYDDYRRQAIALGRQYRQTDQFGFNPPPPPPPPSYEEWRAQTEARRNAWRMPALRVRTTVPVGGASAQTTPTPSRSGASLPPRTTPPPKVPIIRGSARPM